MSFLAKFFIDGKTYNVLECNYKLHQPVDEVGKPIGRPKGGQITLVIESDSDTEFFYWMKEPNQTKSGTITFFKRDTMAKQKTIEFTNAYCIEYEENFIADDRSPMVTHITISAEQIKLNAIDFSNLWGLKK